ncbi:UDP-N-acetylglucosamine--N-acetylmuramyl-(pentapeptide) pyrophosphoryl-undecaprenol N-acetylglucosamine transferase [Clostridia bacterium]|nr:UDP-N-acetylglucosamine--N-acetylmuramyl-(pentapeptide) pyrophosphoryl-undecaprenol N-acetylglucosamine transferase [Clostridia bacterium]
MGKTIVLTGGGTAGHVIPCIALLSGLHKASYKVRYIGSHDGIEKDLITKENIEYHGISTGKFRRYLSRKNILDMFRVLKGISDARWLLKKKRPDIIFSKGGFVSVPVVIAGRLLGIPIIIHESDLTCGLANKISIPFANVVCVSFPETLSNLPKLSKNAKAVLTGSPIRAEIFSGIKKHGAKTCGFDGKKPVLLIICGSLGSVKINDAVREALPKLLEQFQVVHIVGNGNIDKTISLNGYKQFEYVREDLPHIFALSDICVSRAGANSICELAALKKPMLLIPLSKNASRGDQILNAVSYEKQGFARVLYEEDLSKDTLLSCVKEVYENKTKYTENMNKSKQLSGTEAILRLIAENTPAT